MMRPPIRKVCGGCLRSVEIPSTGDTDAGAPSSNECPHCGGEIDSGGGPITPSGQDFGRTDLGMRSPIDSSGAGETIDWAETWTRGTLGVIGRYQLRERLGEGGFGQVFQAFDPRLDRDVALKVLKQPNPSERVMQRFFREARAAARLDHPNIVAVHDAGFENGRCWIAYHYISGRPLWWYRNHHPMDAPTAARIVRELADALDHAHRHGVLHRDLKPANVIMDDHGRPRLTDFGLARRADLDSSLTRDGAMVGTPAYMSPEQAQGNSKNVDERSDIYSLGIMFYELLHGHRPREFGDEPEAEPSSGSALSANRIVRRFRRRPVARSPVPASLQRICDRALAASLDQRYPTARSLADDLDDWLHRNRTRSSTHQRLKVSAAVVASIMLIGCLGLVVAFSPLRSRLSQIKEVSAPNTLLAKPEPGEVNPSPAHSKPAAPTSAKEKAVLGSVAGIANATAIIVNGETGIFHRTVSSCVKRLSTEKQIPFESAAKAKADGYRPCSNCFPGSK